MAIFVFSAIGAGFLTLVAWSAIGDLESVSGQSDDAILVRNLFGLVMIGCLIGALSVMKLRGGNQ
jgi:hypothetical protein